MYYQTRLLPIDKAGRFVAARCHAEYEVGGDDPRETSYASMVTGHIDALSALRDLGSVAFPLLRASPGRVAYQSRGAKGQDDLAASGNYGAAAAEDYRAYAIKMRHAARLAGVDNVRVPRRMLASRAGLLALGFDPAHPSTKGESLAGALRLIDASTATTVGEWSSSRSPVEGRGRGIERYFNVQLGRPLALSADGASVLMRNDMARPQSVIACRLDKELSELGVASFGQGRVLATQAGWVAIDDESAQRWSPSLEFGETLALPRGVLGWGASATPDGQRMLLPATTNGQFWLVGWDGTKARKFAAHRGARRDAMAVLAISDCGEWIASRCDQDVMVTRVADGVSWPAVRLEDQVHHDPSYDGYVVHEHVPAGFGFVGSRLIVLDDAGLREIQLDEVAGKSFVSEAGRPGARKPVRVKPSMSFDELMHAARLDLAKEALRRLHSPAITIHSKSLGKNGWLMPGKAHAPELGASRFGGWPDLPEDVAWPTWRGRPMAFLAQIDLADVAEVQPAARLPKVGLLSFFVGCSEESYENHDDSRERYMVDPMIGTEPDQGDGWRVLYSPGQSKLRRIPYASKPLPELIDSHAVSFKKGGLPLPDEQTAIYAQLPLTEAQRDDYNELIAQLKPDEERWGEQLMGYPTLIQSTPPELMCELAATGRSPWSIPSLGTEGIASLSLDASDWTLLLQLTSQGPFEWGDAGHFYFYGDRAAMERGDFSKIWVNFEN